LLFLSLATSLTCLGQRQNSNHSTLVLSGNWGYPYQSLSASVPMGTSNWQLFGQINTDLGGILTDLGYPDNQSIGVLRKFELDPVMHVKVGAGTNMTLHNLPMGALAAKIMTQLHYFDHNNISLGILYQQPIITETTWDSYSPILQLNTSIHLKSKQKGNGVYYAKQSDRSFEIHLSSGIQYSAVGGSINLSNADHYRLRAQLFSSYLNLFENAHHYQDFQWVGFTLRKEFSEVALETGIGPGVRTNTKEIDATAVALMGIQQKILSETSLTLEVWQPLSRNLNNNLRPLALCGLRVVL